MTPKPKDVDAYIAGAAAEARPTLDALRELVRSTVPDAEERISYGVPFYKYHGELGGFAAYKGHVSFGCGPGSIVDKDRELLEAKGYAIGKMTVQIRFDQKVPTAVIKRILRARAKLNEGDARARSNVR